MSILDKAVLGGSMIALGAWLSTNGNALPEILPPRIKLTLIALCSVGFRGSLHGFRETCTATVGALPAYLVFVGICYLATRKVGVRITFLLGLAGWPVAALLVLLMPKVVHLLGWLL